MKIAYILFNEITWLDFVGVYDPVSRLRHLKLLPDLAWDLCAQTDRVADQHGLGFIPNSVSNSLENYDAIVVPGGVGTRPLQRDERFIHWLQSAARVPLKV